MFLFSRNMYCIVAVCCFLLCGTSASAGAVLLLHSTDTSSDWIAGVTEGLVDTLPSSMNVDALPVGNAQDGVEHFETVFQSISDKYGDQSLDGLIADGPVAYAFLRKYREDLAPLVPVVYCSMPAPDPQRLMSCASCSGVPMDLGVAETVDFIFALRPETSIVVGIIDGSDESQRLRRQAEAAIAPYMDRASLIFPGYEPGDDNGLDMDTLRDVAASVPMSGAILLLQYDPVATSSAPLQSGVSRMLADRSDAPVFAVRQQAIGSGALGGVVPVAEDQGRQAGLVMQRIMEGEDATTMLVEAVPPVPVVDQTVAARFAIPAALYLDKAQIVNPIPQPATGENLEPMTGWLSGGLLAVVLMVFLAIRRTGTPKDR
ncbi:conserved exported protein of unknown function [Pseudodesulfovibrio profundus]|uniref:Uncharacterized protein n=2 Tax=Pseudodesulfovibrio profundus TaxID=57320 RepID=A0A2C8FAU0_9BACT|nr:conserved exported protein of unknown function [Pseudodesulfovibrio profundus]